MINSITLIYSCFLIKKNPEIFKKSDLLSVLGKNDDQKFDTPCFTSSKQIMSCTFSPSPNSVAVFTALP